MNIEERKKYAFDELARLEKEIEILRNNIRECRDRVSSVKTEIDVENFEHDVDLEDGLEIIRLFW